MAKLTSYPKKKTHPLVAAMIDYENLRCAVLASCGLVNSDCKGDI